MNTQFSTLLIPVESQVREFDGKLLLACTAAEKGFNVVIGSRPHMHFYASKVKNSIYLAKSMRRFSERMFKILNQLGHRIIAWDEEALVRLPDEEYYKHRLSPITFKYIDHLFAWGQSDAFVFNNYSGYDNQPIHTFGNPRADILRKELRNYFLPEVQNINNQYGNYCLINTNFGQVNHFIPSLGYQEATRDKKLDLENDFMSKRFIHKKKLLEHFIQLIKSLSETFPNLKFIVRPHPSENVQFWQNETKNYNNVHVNNSGNVNTWIMAATALISNGCTTSLEASILNKPCLGYYPVSNLEIDDALPKAISDISTNNAQVCEKISQIESNDYKTNIDVDTTLKKHIENINGELSVNRITDLLSDAYKDMHYKNQPLARIKGYLHNETRTRVKIINALNKSHRNNSNYQTHRYPEITTQDIYNKINRFSNLLKRYKNINVTPINKHLYSIST